MAYTSQVLSGLYSYGLYLPGLVWAEGEERSLDDLFAEEVSREVRPRIVGGDKQQREKEPTEQAANIPATIWLENVRQNVCKISAKYLA